MNSKMSLAWNVLKRMPKAKISRANIAVTFRCGQQCQMCQIWKHNSEQDADNELSGFEVDRIISQNKLLWVSITGGEPFLNKDIGRILRASLQGCYLVSIVSNGSHPELVGYYVDDALRRSTQGLLVFSISLEGTRADHDKITGIKGSYDKATQTIELLKKINSKRLYIGVEFVLSELTNGNKGYVDWLAKEYKIGVTYTREQEAPYYHNQNGLKPALINKPSYRYSLKPIDIMHNMFDYGLSKNNRKVCEAGRYSVFIDPYANLFPCLPQAPNNPIKNLRETGYVIGDISKEAKELYQKCKAPCYTPCEVYTSMLFRPWRLLW